MSTIDEYKQSYSVVFQDDISFSRTFMKEIKAILDSIAFGRIRDNEGTDLDFKGADLTIMPLQIGVRVRRAQYKQFDQFTQDDKERTKMSCDVYFLGYANKDGTGLDCYMIWDGNDFATKRDAGLIPLIDRKQNQKHSRVWFNCYKNSDIKNQCKVYKIYGNIAGLKSDNTRDSLILKLSQCHLNPGWSVTRQTELFNRYGIFTAVSWDNLTTEQLKEIAAEINQ